MAAARSAAAAKTDEMSSNGLQAGEKKPDQDRDRPCTLPVRSLDWNLAEWSLRRKIALVLAVPVIVAAIFGGLRVNTERQLASEYAASASQVTVLGPAID